VEQSVSSGAVSREVEQSAGKWNSQPASGAVSWQVQMLASKWNSQPANGELL